VVTGLPQQQQDWFVRQIQMLVQFIAHVILNIDASAFEMNEEQMGEMGELYVQLSDMLIAGDICAAEDVLYDSFIPGEDYLRLSMWFYSELNKMTDEALQSSDFSREEIYDGLRDVLCKNGITLP